MSLKKLLPILFVVFSFTAKANYMLVQNVTKLGNNPTNKTIQIQFDLSWQNSWRDDINWDAAWIFIKFKDANGLWQHARINLAGFANGAGTSNTIKVGSDSVGAFVYRSALGSGNFNATSMQLQWNYGASGLTDGSGLEVRVFATEMVYVPEGDFNVNSYLSYAINDPLSTLFFNSNERFVPLPGYTGTVVINKRLTPSIRYSMGYVRDVDINYYSIFEINATFRIKGDAGIDTNNDGIVDNISYATGYKAFYCYKYEMSEQQYADFLNTLTLNQKDTLGVAGTRITINSGRYFSATPNKACGKSNSDRLLAYADWSGLRPMTYLEFNKAKNGPFTPRTYNVSPTYELKDVGYYANSSTPATLVSSGASYYGIMDLVHNASEPVVRLTNFSFGIANGDGYISNNGKQNVLNWTNEIIEFIDQSEDYYYYNNSLKPEYYGFRYVRSAE
jgi:hypothetical protein